MNFRWHHVLPLTVLVSVVLQFIPFANDLASAQTVRRGPRPEDVFNGINDGWPHAFQLLRPHINPAKSYFILNMIEPSLPMDLRSAELFRRSYIAPGITERMDKPLLGHAIIGWQCQRPNGQSIRGATGFTGEGNQQSNKMIKAGWGLTTLASTFTDGYLQSSQSIGKTLERRTERGERIWSVVFEVDSNQCEEMLTFLRDFVFHENRPMQNFGLTVDPEKFEGGGCGSWAVALLNKTRIFSSHVIQQMHRTVSAPTSLMGQNLELPPRVTPFQSKNRDAREVHRVSLLKFLDGPWEGPGPQESLQLVDPEMVILAISRLHHNYLLALQHSEQMGRIQAGTFKAMSRAYFDRYPQVRTVKSRTPWTDLPIPPSNPTTPWFVREIPINEKFDSKASALTAGVQSWWNEKLTQGYQSKMVFQDKMMFMIIDKN